MIRKFIFLTTLFLLVFGGGNAWGQPYEWSHDGQKKTLSVTAAKGSSSVSTYTNYSIIYDGGTYTSAVKMESATTITFTTYASSKVTVGLALKDTKNYGAAKATVKLDGTTSSSAISEATIGAKTEAGVDVTFNNVAAGEHTISRGDDELGVFYIKVEPTATITATYNGINFAGSTLYTYGTGEVSITLDTSGTGQLTITSSDTENTLSTLSSTPVDDGGTLTLTPTGEEGTETLTVTDDGGASTTVNVVYKSGVASYPKSWVFDNAWTNYSSEIAGGSAHWTQNGNHYYNTVAIGAPGSNLLVGATGTQAVTQTYGLRFQTSAANRIWTQSVSGGVSYLAAGDGTVITIPSVPAGYTVGLEVYKTSGSPTMKLQSSSAKNNYSLMYNDGTNNINDYSITGTQASPQLIYVTAVETGDIVLKVSGNFVYFNSISVANVNALDHVTGNTYEVYSPGVLNTQTVSSIPGITMEYGTSAEDQYVRTISGQDGYYAYCVDVNGYTHAYPNTGVPTNGTFYKFTVSSPGTLSVTGVATVFVEIDKSNVVLVKSDGTPVSTTAYDNCSSTKPTKTTLTFSDLEADTYYLYGQGATTWNLQSFTFTPNNKFKTIMVSDMKFSPNVNSAGLNANAAGLDRTLGGFSFEFTGGEGIKYNNGIGADAGIQIRKGDSYTGTITITPNKSDNSHSVYITKVVITTSQLEKYNGSVSVNSNTTTITNSEGTYELTNAANSENFVVTAVSGDVFIKSFTIYYTDNDNVLSTATVTPTITWSKTQEEVTTIDGYTSPTVITVPANYDISIASSNTGVATVADNNWASSVVSLTGTNGTATVTASSTANDFYNAATDATYTVAMNQGGTGKKWDFTTLNVKETVTDDTGWNGGSGWTASGEYYKNAFTCDSKYTSADDYSSYAPTSTQLAGLKFARKGSALSSGNIRLYSSYLTYNNTNVVIGVPVLEGQSVIVTFSDGTYTFDNATVDGDESATSITANSTTTTVTLIASADGYVNLVNSSKAKLYSIEVKDETRTALTMRDNGSNTYNKNTGTNFWHRVTFSPSGSLTAADASLLHITSSDASVVNTSLATVRTSGFGESSSFYFDGITPVSAGSATLTVTFDGNENYKPFTYETHTYNIYGAISSFKVVADDQQIQRGQRSVINPVITDKDGNALGIKLMEDNGGRYTTYVLDEDEDQPDYTQYFEFTFTQAATGTGTNWDQIVVAESTGEVTTENNDGTVTAEPGATRDVTITATPKDDYASAFATSATATTSITLTIIEKQSEAQVDFYWDAERTDTHKITVDNAGTSGKEWAIIATEAKQDNSKLWNFKATGTKYAGGFPNGKMLYVKAKMEGDSIWFSYKKDGTAATIPANPKLDAKNGVYEYRRGIPIYIDEELTSESYVTVNVVATSWDAATQSRKLNGSVVRMRFDLTSHGRPPIPTYEPVSPDADASKNYNESSAKFENKNGGKMMNTSQNVVAYDENSSSSNPENGAGNMVFGKFSTSSVYTTEQLINEKTVTVRKWNVPVVSTEVARRRFTTVQIRKVDSDGDYGYSEYVSPQTHTEYWYLYDTELTLTPNTNFYINIKEKQAAPAYKVTWYNKKTAKQQEVDSYEGKISFAIKTNGAEGTTINATTGEVIAGTNAGWVMVTVTYAGGETHGGKSGEPQYVSTTDKSTATYYVYISDPSQEEPVITPPTRNFTQTQNYRIQAPENWDVRYTIDGTEPTASTDPDIAHGGFVDLSTTETITVKAIAYNPNSPEDVSRVVSETYTKVTPLPDPVFDPDGVATPYRYNTSTLTVQIACAYPGSIIYYTVDGSDPVRGASNTYQYSGLSKVVISGNVAIKAIAYDASRDIYSNVVRSSYIYSDVMESPYFQISDDGGQTWYGFPSVGGVLTQNGTEWSDGQEWTVKPTTQIRIIDPNPVEGTIFYTLDGTTTPSDDVTSMVYVEGYPFTVNKTTLGQAITVLEDASSDVSTANFLIDSASGIDVWEAVKETTPGGTMSKTDGFVISTDEDLSVANTGSKVNWNSLSSSLTEHGTAPKTYAQKYITATFGGFDLQDWSDMTIADRSIGAPIDGVGKFSLKSKDNAKMEAKYKKTPTETDNYNHVNSWEPETIHERTFRVPAKGTYVQFEPERDGDLTIWVLQQGAVHYEEDEYFIDRYIRVKPVYLVDEQGKSYKVKEVNGVPQLWSAARLTENWTKLQATQAADKWSDYTRENNTKGDYIYLRYSDGAVFDALPSGYTEANLANEKAEYLEDPTKLFKKMENKGPNKAESRVIYNLFDDYITKNHISVGDPIKPFAIHSGAALSLNNGQYVDDSNDGTGYVLASGGYAKYTFELKAGKTYYFMGVNTKIGIRGFQFIPTETDGDVAARKSITIHANATSDASTVLTPAGEMSLESAVDDYGDEPVNVTLNRTFKANTWTTLLLPFSVSVAQIEKVFGAQTDIILFDDVINDDREIHMIRHWHKMIVAGTPVIIMPRQNVVDPVFHGVHLEATEVDEISSTNGHYKMTGTFVKAEDALNKYDYYINTSGNFTWLSIDRASVKGSFSWLKVTPSNPNPSRMLSVAFSDFSDNEDEGMATGIINVEMPDNISGNMTSSNEAVYNLKGQKMVNGSLKQLSKGIYIVNGKKVVVE